jgi:hypothetical protein
MIGWDNGWAGHARRWDWIGLPWSELLSITWACSVSVDRPFYLSTFSQQHWCPEFSRFYWQISCDWAAFWTRHGQCEPEWLDTTLAKQDVANNKTLNVQWFAAFIRVYGGKSRVPFSDGIHFIRKPFSLQVKVFCSLSGITCMICGVMLFADSYYSYDYVCIGSSMIWDYSGSLFSSISPDDYLIHQASQVYLRVFTAIYCIS